MAIKDIHQTHTFTILELSRSAFEEIKARLTEAGYEHAFVYDDNDIKIDMHGIAVKAKQEEEPNQIVSGDGPAPSGTGDYVTPSKPWPRH